MQKIHHVDDNFDGLRVEVGPNTEFRACRKAFRGEDRTDLRIWMVWPDKLTGIIAWKPTKKGVFLRSEIVWDKLLPWLLQEKANPLSLKSEGE